jgi:hypothetical protein
VTLTVLFLSLMKGKRKKKEKCEKWYVCVRNVYCLIVRMVM